MGRWIEHTFPVPVGSGTMIGLLAAALGAALLMYVVTRRREWLLCGAVALAYALPMWPR